MDFSSHMLIMPISTPAKLPHIVANLTPHKSASTPMPHSISCSFDPEKRNGLDLDFELTDVVEPPTKGNIRKFIARRNGQLNPIGDFTDQLDRSISCPFQKSTVKKQNCVLHINYNGQQAALVCQVRTNDLAALKHRLSPLLRQHKSRFRNVQIERNLFKPTGLIHALVTCQTPIDLASLKLDAQRCKAQDCKVISMAEGKLCFNCQPSDLAKVTARLRLCGYKPLRSEIGQCARDSLVKLPVAQLQRYVEFLKALKADTDMVKVYDNVENSTATLHG
ncbi:uncharacterized protein LOC132784185 [Drosophila nasuta]|uniref:uncharacterized protein LOC132784185 n=1 Tax=Drosophila nasuta TaxID=42062 RepID=UPI00295F2B6D|nr:uncharacterized protein LOC132784185 [Drosophila nasuta]